MISRRAALGLMGAAGVATAAGFPGIARGAAGRVVVIGGGFGGATTAKYLKQRRPQLSVTLIEPAAVLYTCPFSNLFLGGVADLAFVAQNLDGLGTFGIEIVRAFAEDVDTSARTVRLSTGDMLGYDALVLSPGIDIRWAALEGYDEAAAEKAPHAWKAGPQTGLLRAQLEAMDDGGTFVLVAPDNPYRCPPAPYERASLIANYFKHNKPRSKILILDAKDSFSKQPRFAAGWTELYGDMIRWVGRSDDGKVIRVDADTLEVETEFGSIVRADVLNVVPPQQAGLIARRAGMTDESGWVPVKPATFESAFAEGVYIVGDAAVASPIPKSAFAANVEGRIVAACIVAALEGREPPRPSWANVCYSLVAPDYGISVASIYRLVDGAIVAIEDSGGGSPPSGTRTFRAREAEHAFAWYRAITADTWGTEW